MKSQRGRLWLAQIVITAGLLVLSYPAAADWVSAISHNSEVSGYARSVEQLPQTMRADVRKVADAYNQRMPQGPLLDPYSAQSSAEVEKNAAFLAYEDILAVSENGVIGEVSYPDLGINLPIYHGTSDEVLSKGAGHLYGSSLPVGGPSTHSVLTSHSGLVRARLFTSLLKAERGHIFTVTVLGEQHYYRVDRVTEVLPKNTKDLQIVDGKDYVTLVTCSPIGINSHRTLVRGVRIAAPEGAGTQTIGGDGESAHFPWWAVTLVAGISLSGGTLYLIYRRSARDESRTTNSGTIPRQLDPASH